MSAEPRRELPVMIQFHALMLWAFERAAGFPKRLRATLGDRFLQRFLDVQDALVELRYTKDRDERFRALNLDLERLRFLSRTLSDLRVLSLAQYEHVSRELNAVGSQLGGWHKSEQQKARR